MKIGIVLAAVPGYSETFFRNKIKFLIEEGVEVKVFADSINNGDSFDLCEVRFAPVMNGAWVQPIVIVFHLFWLGITCPLKAFRLWHSNSRVGFTWKENIKSLVKSSHILREDLDWLQFGFGTLAIGRENVARVAGAKMAVSFRGYDIAIYSLKHPGCYDLLWKRVDKVHVISDDIGKLVIQNGYSTGIGMIKITPAIDTARFAWKGKDSFHSPIRIVTTARLHWKKGLEYSLEALSILRDRGIDFHYTIIGDGQERERLVFASYQLRLKDRVTFTGMLDQEQIVDILQSSDLYLQYSLQEGFCNSVLEAQALGLLCIVSDAEGLSENVTNGLTGWVVPKREPDQLASKIMEVLALDRQEIAEVSERASKRVKNEFNLEVQKLAFMELYLK